MNVLRAFQNNAGHQDNATKEQRRERDLIHLNLVRSPAANYVSVYLNVAGAEMPVALINCGGTRQFSEGGENDQL
jgi:hypothetical protein